MDLKLVTDIYPEYKNLDHHIIKYYDDIINKLYNLLIKEKLNFLDRIPDEILYSINVNINKDIRIFNKNFRLYKNSFYCLKPLKFEKFNTNYSKNIENEIFKQTKIILLDNPIIDIKYNNINDLIKDYKKIKNFHLSKLYLNKFSKKLNNKNDKNDKNDIIEIIKLTTILTYINIELIEVGLSNFNNLNDIKHNINEDDQLKEILKILHNEKI
jgi:hypothetical protein